MTAASDGPGPRQRGEGSGHGKAILIGEHHVMDGAPALALGLPAFQTRVLLTRTGAPSDQAVFVAIVHSSGESPHSDGESPVSAAAIEDARRMLSRAATLAGIRGVLAAHLQSSVPVGRGLGSSAALAVAAVRAAHALAGRELADGTLLAQARELEDIVHGRSSGLDPAAACRADAVLYQAGAVVERLTPSPHLAAARWVLFDLGSSLPTREAIAIAQAHRVTLGATALALLTGATTAAAHDAAGALASGDLERLASALGQAGAGLEPLGVVTTAMRHALDLALGAGALAAKQTGAGCGGMLLALAADDEAAARVTDAIRLHTVARWTLPVVSAMLPAASAPGIHSL